MGERSLLRTTVLGGLISLLFLAGGLAGIKGGYHAHGFMALAGFLLPALTFLHVETQHRLGSGGPTSRQETVLARALLFAPLIAAIGWLIAPELFGLGAPLVFFGLFATAGAGVLTTIRVLKHTPNGGQTDAERPITKGDDASWKHIRFAHFFLPVGLLLVAVGVVIGDIGQSADAWAARIHRTGMHFLAAYLLTSLYGLGHLWVPRFSGVPAIAAGAIKGELHSTLAMVVLLPVGFLSGLVGFTIAGGAFGFLGMFTYMGVLGANIMRRKSQTHRVTPEFVYIPWTFAGVFWLISGVLLGVFMNAVPDSLADRLDGLRFTHVHMALLGGAAQLWLGWNTRILPGDGSTPSYAGAMKASFLLWNLAVALAAGGMLTDQATSPFVLAGTVLAAAAAGLYVLAMRAFMRPADYRGAR